MQRSEIALNELVFQPFTGFRPDGALLLAGNEKEANTMTVSWGTFGIMWESPIIMVMVRPQRHTWDFIKKSGDFTLNFLPSGSGETLAVCGSQSGRDIDKFETCNLTKEKSERIASPSLAEAELVFECKTIYEDQIKQEHFFDRRPLTFYRNDFHGLFYGQVMRVTGTDRYR